MTMLLLVGEDVALLEGLAQSLAALGYVPRVAHSLHDAREIAADTRKKGELPLIAVVARALAVNAGAEALGVPLAPGGALVLYRTSAAEPLTLPPTLQRSVLADLTLPLERARLAALVQHVEERARTTGRAVRPTPPEQVAH